MTGAAGPSAQRAARFAQAVADATGVEVELVDERLTTVEATRRLAEADGDEGPGGGTGPWGRDATTTLRGSPSSRLGASTCGRRDRHGCGRGERLLGLADGAT